MKKFIPLFLISFLLFSCDSMYSMLGETKSIKQKTTYKSFNPSDGYIVMSMPIEGKKYLFGNKNNSYKTEKLGDVFVIINYETNEIFDWVFYGDGNQSSWYKPVKVGKTLPKYYNPLNGKSQIACLDPQKNEVDFINVSRVGLFYNEDTPGDYCVIDSLRMNNEYNKRELCFNVFDSTTGVVSENLITQITDSSIFSLVPDSNGDLYFSYLLDGFSYIAKINCKNESISNFGNIKIDCSKVREDCKSFYCVVEYIDETYLFLKKSEYGTGPYFDDEYYLINLQEEKIEKKLNLQLEGIGNDYLQGIVKIKDKYYGIVYSENNGIKSNEIYEIDIINNTSQRISPKNSLWVQFGTSLWVSGTKIYFLDCWNPLKLKYNFFDVSTKCSGMGWEINQSDFLDL